MTTNYTQIRTAAKGYRAAGLSILPIDVGGGKQPYSALLPFENADGGRTWLPLKEKLPTEAELDQMFPGTVPQGIGIIGGGVSGGLEVIDFESDEAWEEFRKRVNDKDPKLLSRLPRVQSPRSSGGHHLYVWSDHAGVSQKLAYDENGELLIEIKGEAGYVLAPGSDPHCHSTGKPYQHDPSTPAIASKPRVTAAERAMLLDVARSLNCHVVEIRETDRPTELRNPNSPGNIYSCAETFATAGLLEKHGWEQIGPVGDRIAWRRPGKETPGFSALSGSQDRHDRDVLCVFSTAAGPLVADFEDAEGQHHSAGRPYTLFTTYTALEHGGNFSRAALELARQGYTAENYPDLTKPEPGAPSRTSAMQKMLLWRPFPLQSLPEPISVNVNDIAQSLGCDPVFVVLPQLGALAGVVGNSRVLHLRDRWQEPAVIWSVVLADSGSLKSPAMDYAIKQVRELQAAAFQEYSQMLASYKEELARYEVDLREWQKSGAKEGNPHPEEPEKPACLRYMVTDITVEALVERLEANPRGVLLATDELSGWVLGLNQYKGGRGSDVAHWLTMHGARQLIFDRKGKEPSFVPHAAVSVSGPVPPSVFKRVALQTEHSENGLLARLLVAMPPNRPKKWRVKQADKRIDGRMLRLLRSLSQLEMQPDENGVPRPGIICMTQGAEAAWETWYEMHAERQVQADPLIRPLYAKLEAYAARFALIFHLVRQAEDQTGEEIDETTMRMAIDVAEWFAYEGARVYAILRSGDEGERLLELAERIRDLGGEATPRDLMRHYSRYESREDAETDLDKLVEKGWAEWRKPASEGRGRPRSKYVRLTIDNIDDKPTTPASGGFASILSTSSEKADAVSGNVGQVEVEVRV